ncbi:MAG: ABC transporter substrate-binding protein [Gemmatimonadales bacterium]
MHPQRRAPRARLLPVLLLTSVLACGRAPGEGEEGAVRITFSGSAVGQEGELLRAQLAAFMRENPDVVVELQSTPDAADQRHQLYVQWLNAHVGEPDVLQLDVIWTAEFAAAGWIRPLDAFSPETEAFFPAAIEASRWRDSLYAMPWFVDVGLLYWRTDLLDAPPATYAELASRAREGMRRGGVPYGFVWQGARYEGLVTVFVEHLHAFGGSILDAGGAVRVDGEAAVRALEFMRDALGAGGITPADALAWQEEQTRFAFQNGEAVMMRNWPYAAALLAGSGSRVADRFSVAPLPAGPGGARASALGGQQLAINAHSDEPDAAWRLIAFLTSREQMLARASAAGHYPARTAPYEETDLAAALAVDPRDARAAIEQAVPRPVTPLYTEISRVLQVALHRALTGQAEPSVALRDAAREMRSVLARLAPPGGNGAPRP